MISSGLGRKPVAKLAFDTSGTNITTAAWVTLIASQTKPFSFLEIYNPTTKILKLAIGSAGNEVELPVYIYPGISSQVIPFDEQLKPGVRLSAKAVDANATTGFLVLNMYA
jgi:hypothetical protein